VTPTTTAYPRHSLSDFQPGVVRVRSFKVDRDSIQHFIAASGDAHPLHSDATFAHLRGYKDVVVHGACILARCTAFVAEEFIGSHGLLVSVSSQFRSPVFCGDVLNWRAEVTKIELSAQTMELAWTVSDDRKAVLQRGAACVWLGTSG
jgi:acyl dehydratase